MPGPGEYLGQGWFWVLVLAITAGLIAMYFILRQAILDAMEEHSRRERERGNRR